MLEALYAFFEQLFNSTGNYAPLDTVINSVVTFTDGSSVGLGEYFAVLCSIVSLIIIVVLCCLFIKQIVKLVGGLIRG